MARRSGDKGTRREQTRQGVPPADGETPMGRSPVEGIRATMFEAERRTYEEHLPELLDSVGKFALVFGEEISGPFDSYAAALDAGSEKYGVQPFMVKQINAVEPVMYFSRELP